MVWIRTPYPDTDSGSGLLPKFNGNFLVQGYICDKILMKIQSLSPKIKLNCGKNTLSRNVEESFKVPGSGSGADDFQNLISSSLSTEIGKIFVKIRSVVKTFRGKVVRHSLAYLSVHKWLVGDVPFYLKFWAKLTHPLEKHRLQYRYSFVAPQP